MQYCELIFWNTCLKLLIDCDCSWLLGKDLKGMSLDDLRTLEQELNEGMLCIKERKVLHLDYIYTLAIYVVLR